MIEMCRLKNVVIFFQTFNICFSSVGKKLAIEHALDDESNLPNADDPILKVIAKYENHRVFQE